MKSPGFVIKSVTDVAKTLRGSNRIKLAANLVNQLPASVPKAASKQALEIVKKAVDGQIESEGVRGGSKYKGLSPKYKKSTNKILVSSGQMRERLKKDSAFKVRLIRGSLIISLKDKVALYHQLGTKKLPQRKILQLTQVDREKISTEFVQIINTQLSQIRRR